MIKVEIDGSTEKYNPASHIDKEDIPALMARWGEILSAWQREVTVKDTAYRMWRARQTQRILLNDPKMSEWKIKAEIESDSEFGKFKQAVADAQFNVGLCFSVLESLRMRTAVGSGGGSEGGAKSPIRKKKV